MRTFFRLMEFGFAILFLGIFMIPSFERFFGMETESLSYLVDIFVVLGIILAWIWLGAQIVILVLQRSGMSSRSARRTTPTGGGAIPGGRTGGGTTPTGGGVAPGGRTGGPRTP